MQIIYKGPQSAVGFNVAGKSIKLTPNNALTITDKQAESLKGRSYVKALVKKGLLEFNVDKPKTTPKRTTKTDKDEG